MNLKKSVLLLFVILAIALIFAGCNVLPTPVTGAITGQVKVPASGEMSKDISGWVPAAGATVTVVDTDGVTHTVTTDENGYYSFENISVNPNTVITATAETEGSTIVLKKVIPVAVAEDENYDAGTMTPEDTALALVIEGLLNAGMDPADIDSDEIKDVNSFDDLVEQITTGTEEGNNVTEDPDVIDKVDDIVDKIMNPPTPPSPPVIVSVTGVSIDQEDQLLAKGATLNLTATIQPVNATNKNVTWASDDEAVATVSADGVVTTAAEGTAIITVTTENGNKTDTIEITVANVVNTTQGKGYETISDAIDEADAGDTIEVGTGTYPENLLIDKSINLIGMGMGNTIIEGTMPKGISPMAIVTIGEVLYNGIATRQVDPDTNPIVSNVSISGFSIVYPEDIVLPDGLTNIRSAAKSSLDLMRKDDGIERGYSGNPGILIFGASSCEISDNEIITYGGVAIALFSSSNITLSENEISENEVGIGLEYSFDNTIETNQINMNIAGILLFDSDNNHISGNDIVDSFVGIYLEDNSWSNSISGNTIENEELIFSDFDIKASRRDISRNSYIEPSGILLSWDSSYNDISGNTINNHYVGILAIEDSNQNNITNNTISDVYYSGILSEYNQGNTISGNTVDNSGIDLNEFEVYGYGIQLAYSYYNDVSQNTINGNIMGIGIVDSWGNNVEENTVYNNRVGIVGLELNPDDYSVTLNGRDLAKIPIESNVIVRNKIYDNTEYGMYVDWYEGYAGINSRTGFILDASRNWWGDASGPYHEVINPEGLGNAVSNGGIYLNSWYIDEAMTELYHIPFN
jgi:parallel beta-helix repeat protein